jgi:hypothetical protein
MRLACLGALRLREEGEGVSSNPLLVMPAGEPTGPDAYIVDSAPGRLDREPENWQSVPRG